jgi:hypothetical protein
LFGIEDGGSAADGQYIPFYSLDDVVSSAKFGRCVECDALAVGIDADNVDAEWEVHAGCDNMLGKVSYDPVDAYVTMTIDAVPTQAPGRFGVIDFGHRNKCGTALLGEGQCARVEFVQYALLALSHK